MNYNRVALTGLTSIVLVTAIISGPLVAGVDLSPGSGEIAPGSGTADIRVESAPSTAVIDRTSGDTDESYELMVPDATVSVSNVTGTPLLVYKIQIRELGHTRGTTYFLNSSGTGRRSLSLDRSYFSRAEISKSEYSGTATIILRSDTGEQQLYHGNISVKVRE